MRSEDLLFALIQPEVAVYDAGDNVIDTGLSVRSGENAGPGH